MKVGEQLQLWYWLQNFSYGTFNFLVFEFENYGFSFLITKTSAITALEIASKTSLLSNIAFVAKADLVA